MTRKNVLTSLNETLNSPDTLPGHTLFQTLGFFVRMTYELIMIIINIVSYNKR